jgi:hypothetical protein
LLEQVIVVGVGSDPKPNDGIFVLNTESTPANTDANRIHRMLLANPFELKAGVIRMLLPELVASAGTMLDVIGETPKTLQEFVSQV